MRESSQLGSVIVLASVLTFWAPEAGAEVLMTQSGELIETQGPWKVKGRQVIFTSPQGVLSSLRLSDVDLEASEEAWQRRQEEAATPPKEETAAAEPARRESILALTNEDLGEVPLEDAAEEIGQLLGEAMGAMAEGMARGLAEGMEEAFGGEAESAGEGMESAGQDLAEGFGEAMEQGMGMMGEFMGVAIEIGLEASEIEKRYDLDTAQGMGGAASEFDALAGRVRDRKAGAKPEIHEMLDDLAQQFEDLAALAREDPEAAVRQRQEAKEEED